MIGETSALQAQIDARGPRSVRAVDSRAGFRSGTPGRRAQDALAQDAGTRLRAPIFDLRATNRQAPHDPHPLETVRASRADAAYHASEPRLETIVPTSGTPATAGQGNRNPLRRLSVNDAYLSAETLDGPYAHRGSVFDLQI